MKRFSILLVALVALGLLLSGVPTAGSATTLQGGVSVNVYPPLDPRNYPNEDPRIVRPVRTPATRGQQCVPADPSWRLLERYGDHCLYAAPLPPDQVQRLRGYAVVPAAQAQASHAGPCSIDPWDDGKLVCRSSSPAAQTAPSENGAPSAGGNVVALAMEVKAYVDGVADSGGVHCGSDYPRCQKFTQLSGQLSAAQKTLPHPWPVQCYDEMMGAWQSAQRGLASTHAQSQASVDCYAGRHDVAQGGGTTRGGGTGTCGPRGCPPPPRPRQPPPPRPAQRTDLLALAARLDGIARKPAPSLAGTERYFKCMTEDVAQILRFLAQPGYQPAR
jgi:hypothetical protein